MICVGGGEPGSIGGSTPTVGVGFCPQTSEEAKAYRAVVMDSHGYVEVRLKDVRMRDDGRRRGHVESESGADDHDDGRNRKGVFGWRRRGGSDRGKPGMRTLFQTWRPFKDEDNGDDIDVDVKVPSHNPNPKNNISAETESSLDSVAHDSSKDPEKGSLDRSNNDEGIKAEYPPTVTEKEPSETDIRIDDGEKARALHSDDGDGGGDDNSSRDPVKEPRNTSNNEGGSKTEHPSTVTEKEPLEISSRDDEGDEAEYSSQFRDKKKKKKKKKNVVSITYPNPKNDVSAETESFVDSVAHDSSEDPEKGPLDRSNNDEGTKAEYPPTVTEKEPSETDIRDHDIYSDDGDGGGDDNSSQDPVKEPPHNTSNNEGGSKIEHPSTVTEKEPLEISSRDDEGDEAKFSFSVTHSNAGPVASSFEAHHLQVYLVPVDEYAETAGQSRCCYELELGPPFPGWIETEVVAGKTRAKMPKECSSSHKRGTEGLGETDQEGDSVGLQVKVASSSSTEEQKPWPSLFSHDYRVKVRALSVPFSGILVFSIATNNENASLSPHHHDL